MADNNLEEFPSNQSPSTPPPSIPLQLSGFSSGDTIQVQGDTDTLQFSVQFNIHHKQHNPEDHILFQFPNLDNQTSPSSDNHLQFPFTKDPSSFGSASSYLTPNTNHPEEEDYRDEGSDGKAPVLTRLRSGTLSRVTYFPPRSAGGISGRRSMCSGRRKERKRETGDVMERVLRRRCFPVRPCSSYAFFVTATWGAAKSRFLTFGETSKRLGKMWCRLPNTEKQVYEEMALKDNERYRRQNNQLKNITECGELED